MKKFIKWKILIATCLVCLVPILFGVILWNKLPDAIAIHFDMNNNPNNYASKHFAVFGMPIMMVLLQIFCCIINDVNAKKYGDRNKLEKATKWIIPVMSILLQAITLLYALGMSVDIRRWVMAICGVIFLVIGNYLPKFNYIKNKNVDTEKARKINRFMGFLSVIMGILALITLLMPPVASIIWLISLIIYTLITIIYSAVVIKK